MENESKSTGVTSRAVQLTPEQDHLAARIAGMFVISFAQDGAIGAPLEWFSDLDGQAAVDHLIRIGVLVPSVGAQTGLSAVVLNPALAERLASNTLLNNRRFRT